MQKYFDSFLMRLKELQGDESVSAFARRLAMPQNTLDCYMRGTRKPSVELLTRVCDTCGVSADWLLGRDTVREMSRGSFRVQVPVRAPQSLHDDGETALRTELAELKRRVAVLEKAQTNPAFACG